MPIRTYPHILRRAPESSTSFGHHAGLDLLREEGRAYAEQLREAHNSVEARDYPGMVHDFIRFPGTSTVRGTRSRKSAAS